MRDSYFSQCTRLNLKPPYSPIFLFSYLFIFFFLIFSVRSAVALEFDPEPLLKQAAVYLDDGRFLECIDTYYQVYSYARDKEVKALALVRVADVLALFLGQKDKAINVYTQAISEFPRAKALNNAYFNSGMLFYELGQLEKSREKFKQYIESFPDGLRVFTAQYMLERIEKELKEGRLQIKEPEEGAVLKKEPWIRVVLHQSREAKVRFDSSVQSGNEKILPSGVYVVNLDEGQVVINGHKWGRKVILKPQGKLFYLQNRSYHGQLVLLVKGNKILFINYLPLETYLLGVVPKEMSPSWHLEALKAQAVAARSYAYFLILKSEDKEYDVAATTASQVYGGAGVGNEKTKRAVLETRGEILTYNNEPVLSYFHAHSGGVLEDASLVWRTDLPYYKVVQDDISQTYKPLCWHVSIAKPQILKALQKHGFRVNKIKALQPAKYSPSGRIIKVAVTTDTDVLKVNSNSLRIWLGPTKIKSTLCSIENQGNVYIFSGKGYGHGVGMSQWGAQGLASQGQNYRQILNHYYPGTEVKRRY